MYNSPEEKRRRKRFKVLPKENWLGLRVSNRRRQDLRISRCGDRQTRGFVGGRLSCTYACLQAGLPQNHSCAHVKLLCKRLAKQWSAVIDSPIAKCVSAALTQSRFLLTPTLYAPVSHGNCMSENGPNLNHGDAKTGSLTTLSSP